MTPALVRVTEEDPFARRVAGAENMSNERKNPSNLCIGNIFISRLIHFHKDIGFQINGIE